MVSLGIRQSFSAKGCPYDNAPIESFHAILKKEFVYRTLFKSLLKMQEHNYFSILMGVIIEIKFTPL
ncbi:hypothetical protein DVB69_15650 [Sporosarcina sp. BI001-red]|nr:hypothetical protein DVB69_15650 [Sporosarcina sp. BI001-red]